MRNSVAVVIAASTALSGCGDHAGDGATVSRNYQVGNFQQIEVAGPYDVEVRTGAGPTVSARGSEKLLGRTVVAVQGDKLVIHTENNRSVFSFGWGSHGKAHFTITVPQLTGAAVAGSGAFRVDRIQGPRFEGSVAGSGGIEVAALDVQQLKASIAGSGGFKAGSGKAQSAEYEIAGSGDINAGGVQAQQAKISISGSGAVRANVTGTADIDIMGSGDANISGGAKCTVNKMGSGSARCS
jgi:hypothetical protein